jgi:hypothetical protein
LQDFYTPEPSGNDHTPPGLALQNQQSSNACIGGAEISDFLPSVTMKGQIRKSKHQQAIKLHEYDIKMLRDSFYKDENNSPKHSPRRSNQPALLAATHTNILRGTSILKDSESQMLLNGDTNRISKFDSTKFGDQPQTTV